MTTFTATPVVWIEFEWDDDLFEDFSAWRSASGIEFVASHSHGFTHKSAYHPDDAERVIAWLREHGAEERRDG